MVVGKAGSSSRACWAARRARTGWRAAPSPGVTAARRTATSGRCTRGLARRDRTAASLAASSARDRRLALVQAARERRHLAQLLRRRRRASPYLRIELGLLRQVDRHVQQAARGRNHEPPRATACHRDALRRRQAPRAGRCARRCARRPDPATATAPAGPSPRQPSRSAAPRTRSRCSPATGNRHAQCRGCRPMRAEIAGQQDVGRRPSARASRRRARGPPSPSRAGRAPAPARPSAPRRRPPRRVPQYLGIDRQHPVEQVERIGAVRCLG